MLRNDSQQIQEAGQSARDGELNERGIWKRKSVSKVARQSLTAAEKGTTAVQTQLRHE